MAWYFVLVAAYFSRHSFLYSSSSFSGIFYSSWALVVSNLCCVLKNLIASKHLFRSLSVLSPSMFPTITSFLSKNFFFLWASHQFFHALNLYSAISAFDCWTACLKAKKTLYLYVVSVTISASMSYRSCMSCYLILASHFMKDLRFIRWHLLKAIDFKKSSCALLRSVKSLHLQR